MRLNFSVLRLAVVASLLSAAVASPTAYAQGAGKGASGLPLPRFVSLKSKRVNIRIGPSADYAVSWMYTRLGLPMEVIQEYENWRRVRDAEGTEGWVNQALLSGDRTALAAPWMREKGKDVYVNLRKEPQSSAQIIAKLEPGVIMHIRQCNGDWCQAKTEGVEGWVNQGEIWGAYPGEAFK
ncbi:SH3 domain-containing protein [Rhizobium oryzicola]|uniref:SH3 domain-containing protein n=1 Tax=Rhizobium oryzicola TaxID=1232668 RepID=A0ABT8SQ02_9HYPH|nr:SH3 domain-containing protein [Rhizobium oryzicola]MDO1580574.1 SH3 domain-containing protein [Rhizobium oryzicola]